MKTLHIFAILAILIVAGCSRTASLPGKTTGFSRANAPKATGADASAQSIDVQLGEWFVKLSPDSVPDGEITFSIKNVATHTHALEIKGMDVDKRSADVPAGKSDELKVTLKPGTYTAYCPIDAHESKGMKATLVVTGAASTSGQK